MLAWAGFKPRPFGLKAVTHLTEPNWYWGNWKEVWKLKILLKRGDLFEFSPEKRWRNWNLYWKRVKKQNFALKTGNKAEFSVSAPLLRTIFSFFITFQEKIKKKVTSFQQNSLYLWKEKKRLEICAEWSWKSKLSAEKSWRSWTFRWKKLKKLKIRVKRAKETEKR